ncbi:MAG TPA: STAS domain-containing protein [Solirubrobacteraceae bacterium]|jgi:anti-anti-sigma factor|nr:STAS domain-containing protein [Solirubrobacteraceae bacterium]
MTGVEVQLRAEIPVARPQSDIDGATARQIRDGLARLVEDGADSIVLDLSDTPYVDSAGIDMLFRLSERLRQRRAVLYVVIPDEAPLRRLAQIVGLERAVSVHPTVEAALASAAPASDQPGAAPS